MLHSRLLFYLSTMSVQHTSPPQPPFPQTCHRGACQSCIESIASRKATIVARTTPAIPSQKMQQKHATHGQLSDSDPPKSIDPRVVDAAGGDRVGEDAPSTARPEAPSPLGEIASSANGRRSRSSFFSTAAIKRGSAPAARRFFSVSERLASSLLSASLHTAVAIFSAFAANRSISPMSASRLRFPRFDGCVRVL